MCMPHIDDLKAKKTAHTPDLGFKLVVIKTRHQKLKKKSP